MLPELLLDLAVSYPLASHTPGVHKNATSPFDQFSLPCLNDDCYVRDYASGAMGFTRLLPYPLCPIPFLRISIRQVSRNTACLREADISCRFSTTTAP